jgi:hypothetical protein
MPGSRQIRIRGKQREQIDVDLLAQLVVMLGRQLAREAAGGDQRNDHTSGGAVDLAALLAAEERQNPGTAKEVPS